MLRSRDVYDFTLFVANIIIFLGLPYSNRGFFLFLPTKIVLVLVSFGVLVTFLVTKTYTIKYVYVFDFRV